MIHLTFSASSHRKSTFRTYLLRMKDVALPTLMFGLLCASAAAEVTKSPDISSLEAGIVCAPIPVGTSPAPGTLAGVTHIIAEEPDFVSNTRQVPAVRDIGFGVKAQSIDPEGIGGVTILLTHPEMGESNVTEQTFVTSISGTDPSLTFYQFDYDYELVLGPWQFKAMSGEDVLYAVSFEVVDPRFVPELAGVCGFLDLLS